MRGAPVCFATSILILRTITGISRENKKNRIVLYILDTISFYNSQEITQSLLIERDQ